MLEHQTHLEQLMSFKEQCRAQMDHHWQKLENLKSKVAAVQTDTALQSQHLMAHLDGLCSTTKQANTTARNNILDIRARLLPNL
jgi:hypothetical protein